MRRLGSDNETAINDMVAVLSLRATPFVSDAPVHAENRALLP
jgi:hypothetical protein